jgi:hypothetical protein
MTGLYSRPLVLQRLAIRRPSTKRSFWPASKGAVSLKPPDQRRGAVEPTSLHQEQVTGKRSTQSAEHASQLMAEARKMSEAGDEQECMKRLAELKDILRVK